MKNIKLLCLIVCFLLSGVVSAQQMGLHSQYMLNDFSINPAIAGVKSYVPVQLSLRRQWAGIKEAPITQTLSTHGYLGGNMGMGLNIYNQVTGPTRRTGFSVASAYHIALEGKQSLSFGLAPVLYQYKLSQENLTPETEGDPAIQSAFNHQFVPDANVGVFFSDGNVYYAGLSVHNLMQSKIDLFNTTERKSNYLMRTFYLTGAYNYNINELFMLQSGLLMQKSVAAPVQFDISARVFYDKFLWAGFSYRNKDAVVAYLGIKRADFLVGYSYDITFSDLKSYSSGTHEIVAALHLMSSSDKRRPGGIRTNSFTPRVSDF